MIARPRRIRIRVTCLYVGTSDSIARPGLTSISLRKKVQCTAEVVPSVVIASVVARPILVLGSKSNLVHQGRAIHQNVS